MTVRRFVRIARLRVRSIWRPSAVDDETTQELHFHLEQLTREKLAEGLPAREARAAALRALGNPSVFMEESRDVRRVRWLHDLRQDLTYGLRILRRHPGFTTIAVASLGLGIGANTATLGAVDSVLVQQLPFADPDRLVVLRSAPVDHPDQITGVTVADYRAWTERATTLEGLALSMPWQADFGLSENGAPPERLLGQLFTPEVFTTLGVQPLMGRTFREDEAQLTDAARVIVISHGLWQRRFAGDPHILGTRVHMESIDRTVIGVMPPTFLFQDARVEFWLPIVRSTQQPNNPSRLYSVSARLKPGVTVADAQAELTTIAAQLALEQPNRAGWRTLVRPIREALYGWTAGPLLTLQAAVTLLLVVACANIAALLLVRGAAREPEIRLRVALGATHGRIGRQLLAEGLLLSLAGGAVGLVVASLGLHGLAVALQPPLGAPYVPPLGLNVRVIAVAFVLVVICVLSFGLGPAMRTAHRALSGRRGTSPAVPGGRSTAVLVAAEVALASVLLVGAMLLTKSMILLTARDLGFDPAGLLTFDFRAPGPYARAIGTYQGNPYFEINPGPAQFLQRVHERLRTVPGVAAVAASTPTLLDSALVPAVPVADSSIVVSHALVTPGFFTTVRAAVLRGRDFTERDTAAEPWGAIVNESAARLLWPGADALGSRVTLDIVPEERPRTVIGVVHDIPLRRLQLGAEPVVYTSTLQQPGRYRAPWSTLFGQLSFVVRPAPGTGDVLPAIRRALAELAPERPLSNVRVLSDLSPELEARRSYAVAIGAFAGVAVLLAAIGVYGVVAYAVARRTREIGVRRALGAATADLVSLIGRRVTSLVVAGLVSGLAAAFVLTRLIASQLWRVAPTDMMAFVTATFVVIAAGVGASLVPLRRAAAVDPTEALKTE